MLPTARQQGIIQVGMHDAVCLCSRAGDERECQRLPEFGVDKFNELVKSVQCPRAHAHTHTHTHTHKHTHTHIHTHTRFRCLGVFDAQCKGPRLIPAGSRASGEFFAARISPSVSVSVSVFPYCATKAVEMRRRTTCTHMRTQTHTHIHTRTHMHRRTQSHRRTNTHAHAHTHAHTLSLAPLHTHAHTYTQHAKLAHACSSSSSSDSNNSKSGLETLGFSWLKPFDRGWLLNVTVRQMILGGGGVAVFYVK